MHERILCLFHAFHELGLFEVIDGERIDYLLTEHFLLQEGKGDHEFFYLCFFMLPLEKSSGDIGDKLDENLVEFVSDGEIEVLVEFVLIVHRCFQSFSFYNEGATLESDEYLAKIRRSTYLVNPNEDLSESVPVSLIDDFHRLLRALQRLPQQFLTFSVEVFLIVFKGKEQPVIIEFMPHDHRLVHLPIPLRHLNVDSLDDAVVNDIASAEVVLFDLLAKLEAAVMHPHALALPLLSEGELHPAVQ